METGKDVQKGTVFECFFIVKRDTDGTHSRKHTFPRQSCDEKELQQCEKFCFPLSRPELSLLGQKHQHFTFMLTDIDKKRKYGFCKLTDTGSGKQCYCFLSTFPWFEIFYKCLNCVCTIHIRNDLGTLRFIVEKLYKLPIPKPNDIVAISTSLTFSVPSNSSLPSIPENRNMMEYISSMNVKNMMEIFAALMYERRIIFTSSNLSALTGCVFASESLLNPLTWQHIYIPVMHEHITDYCAAPMPYIIGLHSSLFTIIQNTSVIDGVVVVDIDRNTVDTTYDDIENMPGEAIAYLRSQLGKPNISVGTNLAEAFLKTQARLFGEYRSALRFRMGEMIVFDDEKFIELHKPGSRRNFAEELVKLQTFQEFIDKRLHMLNNGIGFHDAFENEVSELQHEKDYTGVYKEWLTMTRKSSEFITNVKRQAKSNMKQARESAKQSMKDMKHAIKAVPKEPKSSTLTRNQSLRENISSARPPRPPPPRFSSGTSKTVTRFKMIEEDSAETDNPVTSDSDQKREVSQDVNSSDMLLIDLTPNCQESTLSTQVHEVKHADIFSTNSNFSLLSLDSNDEVSGNVSLFSGRQQEKNMSPFDIPVYQTISPLADRNVTWPDNIFSASSMSTSGSSTEDKIFQSAPSEEGSSDPLISFD